MKNIFVKTMSVCITVSMFLGTVSVISKAEEALPTTATVIINGQQVNFEAYSIEGYNYFKLRDLAYALNGTEKQFSVGYDESTNLVSLTSNQPYTSVGGEMEIFQNSLSNAEPTLSKIVKDGKEISPQVYIINDNNYFKLRDIGDAFDFGVDWDAENSSILIDTSKSYGEEGENMNHTYYSDYTKGQQIKLYGKVDELEEYRGYSKSSEDYIITAHFTDEDGNKWIVPINIISYGIGKISDYTPFKGKQVIIEGVFEGYSEKYTSPCVTVYEITDKTTGTAAVGMRKAEELARNSEQIVEGQFIGEAVDAFYTVQSMIEAWMRVIETDMLKSLDD